MKINSDEIFERIEQRYGIVWLRKSDFSIVRSTHPYNLLTGKKKTVEVDWKDGKACRHAKWKVFLKRHELIGEV